MNTQVRMNLKLVSPINSVKTSGLQPIGHNAVQNWKSGGMVSVKKVPKNEVEDWEQRCKEIVLEFQKLVENRRIESESKGKNTLQKNPREDKSLKEGQLPKFGQWNYSFQKLLAFRKQYGHCLVPCEYEKDPSLARWVKRQRYQYYLLIHGKKSSMTKERIEILDDIGFIWQAQDALWQERFHELLKFKKKHGHCSVPTTYPPNQKLATWVKFQRRQYRLHLEGRPSYISDERIAILEKIGFQWAFFLKDVDRAAA